MKTDVVLTMDEYLDQCCVTTKHVRPPAPDARHVPITAENELDSGTEAHGCRCDRWGHPCPGCVKSRHEAERNAAVFGGVTNKR
jgi:hypothetical protein